MEIEKMSYWQFLEKLYEVRILEKEECVKANKPMSDFDFIANLKEIEIYKKVIKDLKLRKEWK